MFLFFKESEVMKEVFSSNRTAGFLLTIACLVLMWFLTYEVVGAPTLEWSSFPAIPAEYFAKLKPFKVSALIVIWMATGLLTLQGLLIFVSGKASTFLRTTIFPIVRIAIWAIPSAGLGMEMELDWNGVILCALIGCVMATRINAKIDHVA